MLKGDLIEQKVTNKTSCYAFSPTVLTLRLETFLGHYSIVCQSPIYGQFQSTRPEQHREIIRISFNLSGQDVKTLNHSSSYRRQC